jgi:hypothetical protein
LFQSTITLFDRYYRAVDSARARGFNRELGVELRERLQQMDWLVSRVQELEQRADNAMARSQAVFRAHVERIQREGLDYEAEPAPGHVQLTSTEAADMLTAEFEIKLNTESFYYLAGRARTLLRHGEEPLPGLASFEAKGARDVRNHLLEHPEGASSRVFANSWGRGGVSGPVLKSIRNTGGQMVFRDAGLYVNATEFRDRLEQVLTVALRVLGV